MSLLNLIIILIIVGAVLYLINNFIPMDVRIKKLLNILVVVFIIIWLTKALGVWSYLSNITL